ncbi:helix-turn-helix domain-containing protein [Actinoplanes sp. NPDC049596]|uniref:helix-turn-helix domain-containing protein n=1 Tax=unclassified Actinoplanes TaxID=2626549 RepID=UPI00342BCCE7
MVKNRHDIRRLDFSAPAGIPPAIEVMRLSRLWSKVGPSLLAGPQRPTFHHLITLDRGTLRHTVDFAEHLLTPKAFLWVRPGQVQQWSDLAGTEGTLILFEPDFLDHDPHGPVRYEADQRLTASAEHLADVFADPGPLPLETRQAVLRHLLTALVLQLSATAGASAPPPGDTFVRFRDAVERGFARTHRLEDYAQALGYSARTLSRAAQAAAGVNGKDFIDQRIILEAKRLLAHSDHTAAQIAARLGFTSATNFSKYFHIRTGVTPITFRAGQAPGTQ